MSVERALDTKQRIFDQSIQLVAHHNFETVSMRDIAEAVGIKAASIYNHYYSKEDLLLHFYEYYLDHVFDRRPPIDNLKRRVHTSSRRELVGEAAAFLDVFRGEDFRMIHLTRIVYERRFSDPRAAEICLQTADDNTRYICEVLDYAIRIGRLPPFSSWGYANAFVAQFMVYAVYKFVKPDSLDMRLASADDLTEWMCAVLPRHDSPIP